MVLQLQRAQIPPHPLENLKIQKYHQNESKFNVFYPRDNLPKKNVYVRVYVIHLDEYADVGIHWIAFYVKNKEIIYFYSLGV